MNRDSGSLKLNHAVAEVVFFHYGTFLVGMFLVVVSLAALCGEWADPHLVPVRFFVMVAEGHQKFPFFPAGDR